MLVRAMKLAETAALLAALVGAKWVVNGLMRWEHTRKTGRLRA